MHGLMQAHRYSDRFIKRVNPTKVYAHELTDNEQSFQLVLSVLLVP